MDDEQYLDRTLNSIIEKHHINEARFPILMRASVAIGALVIKGLDAAATMQTGQGCLDYDAFSITSKAKFGRDAAIAVGIASGLLLLGPVVVSGTTEAVDNIFNNEYSFIRLFGIY